MARAVVESWIPEEYGGAVISKIGEVSAVEALAAVEPMATDTKRIPRDGDMTFEGATAKGATIAEDAGTVGEVVLTARKFTRVVRLADEDVKDTAGLVNVIATKQAGWARAYAIGFDNATLATTAVGNGGTVPFNSLYYTLTQANSDTGYTANANLTKTAGALNLDDIDGSFGLLETGDYYAESDLAVIAHPAFKSYFRSLGRDKFSEFSSMGAGNPDRLNGAPIRWTLGARTHATATNKPSGNPLMFVGNTQYLVKGDRSGPEYMIAGADSGPAFLTDEALLKFRIRRGFAVTIPNAWSCIEITAS